jgi:release factor glutamine methyltransferase
MARIDTLLENAARQFSESDSPRLDAEVLLAHTLHKPRSYLRAFAEDAVDSATEQAFTLLVARRAAGEPVAHLTGEREFWSLPLQVSAETLIPRPDTELLVEQALEHIPLATNWRIADLGTGSGAIALAIASERPHCQIVATDISTAALATAQANAQRLGLTNVEFRHSDWCSALAKEEQFELIVSNPPYIRAADPHLEQGDVRFESRLALVAGEDGLDAIRLILKQARQHLVSGGWLLIEHGYDQGASLRELFGMAGYENVKTLQDSGQNDRLSLACLP